MTGYREAAQHCEMCLAEPGPGQSLEPYAGLKTCAGCREDHRAAARAWGLELRADAVERRAYRSSGHVSTSDVRLPTRVNMYAVLRAEVPDGGPLQQRDPGAGDDWFRRTVRLQEEPPEGVTGLLLQDRRVQDAVVEAAWAADRVELAFDHVVLTRKASLGFSFEELHRMDRAAVVLALCIERWARGAPGSTSLRQGCSPAPLRQPVPPNLGPDRYQSGRPPRDCPTCGETMVSADLEDICTRCGLSLEIKDAGKVRLRRRLVALAVGLLAAALLVGLIALMATAQ